MTKEIDDPLSDKEKMDLMRVIKSIAKLYDKTCDPDGDSERYREGVMPYTATARGICLEYYYGNPSKLWTPWGKWHFGAVTPSESAVRLFMSRLKVRELRPLVRSRAGEDGPLYAVLAVGRHKLPEPAMPSKGSPFDDMAANREWRKLYRSARAYRV